MTDTHVLTNRMIAERLGWRVSVDPVDRRTALLEPDNTIHNMWNQDNMGDNVWAFIPAYLSDCSAALTLPLPDGYRFALSGAAGDTWHCYVENADGASDDRAAAHGDDPADVVSRAWWAFQEQAAE
jgi:hypothetical protein